MIERLTARKVDRIKLSERGSQFRLSNMIRCYCQAHLRRLLLLTESAVAEFFTENGLVSLACVRER